MTYEEKLKEEYKNRFEYLKTAFPEGDADYEQVWSFISQSLSNYKKELMEEIKKLDKMPEYFTEDTVCRYVKGDFKTDIMVYNEAITDLLSLLQKDKENK